MTEKLLQYIWNAQFLNTQSLQTLQGERIEILQPGKWNTHKHQWDPHYRNVILHVVWEHDTSALHTDHIPILELQSRVSKILLQQYAEWMDRTEKIPCSGQLLQVPDSILSSWIDRLTRERLFRKTAQINDWLQLNEQHWEETCWWLMARHFGSPTNSDAFEALAKSIPFPVLLGYRNQIHQLEALLLGQAGLLHDPFEESYPEMLRKEYQFQQLKFQLQPVNNPFHFLRMRPGNFPTIRLAQLAMLLHQNPDWLTPILKTPDQIGRASGRER